MQSRVLVVLLSLTLLAAGADAQGRRRSMRSAPGPRVTTFDNIDRAVTEGRISPDQGMLYKVFSVYGDGRLPQDMRGDDHGLTDTTFMSEVAAKYATLPVDVQQQVAPFLIPPFHQNSWWELRRQAQARTYSTNDIVSYGIGPDKPCLDCPLSLDWAFVPTANGKVKVWYHASDVQAEAKAKDFVFEIDQRIWPKLHALMGREPLPDDGNGFWLGAQMGGDSRLDIALVDIGRSVTTGMYNDKCGSAAWAYIQFNKSKPREELAHEIMHAFQYAFNVKVRGGDCTHEQEYRWLMESTAEWVKDYVYPGSTSPHNEHSFAPAYLGRPEMPLNYRDDPHWYGAYLFPFFLARMKGQQTIVGQIWANTESLPSLRAVEQALQPLGGFEKVWPEFVVQNWNDEPVDDYEKIDQLTHRPQAHGATLPVNGAVDTYATLGTELHHLTATYKHFKFSDAVNSFAFLNGFTFKLATEPRTFFNGVMDLGEQYKWDPVPEAQRKGASVHAILRKNGQWQEPEDWTNVPYKAFCRQKSTEKIDEIVLIFANGNIDENVVLKPQGLAPLLIATDMACRFEGTMDWDSSATTKQGLGNVDLTYHNTWEPRDFMEPVQHFLGYFYDVTGYADWTVTGPVGPCGINAGKSGAPLRTDLATWSMNFAPKGSKGYRKGYYQLVVKDPVAYTMNCPGGSVPMEAHFIAFPAISFDPLMYVNAVQGGGLKDSKTNQLGTWKWDYRPKK